jgi:hypothetical protein
MILDLRAAFERQGIRAVIRGGEDKEGSELREQIQQETPDCIWTINTFIDERSLYYPLGIPHVDLSVDSFTNSSPAELFQSSTVNLFVDKASCDLFSAYSNNPVHWFPHGISKEMIEKAELLPVIPLQDRPFDVSLVGSFIDNASAKKIWDELFDPADVAAFVSFAERTLEDPSFILLAEALKYIEGTPRLRQLLDAIELPAFSLANHIERYARGLDRERLLRALKGRSVHIFTDPSDADLWAKEESAQGCLFHPPVPFHEVMDICRKSKVVINSSPHIRKGYHERLFLSLASGAITLVRKGMDFPSWVTNEGRVVEYASSPLEGLISQLQEAEKKPYAKEKILPWLDANHSWDARLQKHLPQIEKSVKRLHEVWEENPFWRMTE